MRALCGLWGALLGLGLAHQELHISSAYKPSGCDTAHKARRGDAAALIVTGWIEESNVKFTEYDKGHKMETVLGRDPALRGLHMGVEGMCVGERRTVVVPPGLAHGDNERRADFATIPPNSALRFDVELAALGSSLWHEHGKPMNVFKQMDTDADGRLSAGEFAVWFRRQGKEPPTDLWKKEDKDGDGFIALAEFSGPKGAPEL